MNSKFALRCAFRQTFPIIRYFGFASGLKAVPVTCAAPAEYFLGQFLSQLWARFSSRGVRGALHSIKGGCGVSISSKGISGSSSIANVGKTRIENTGGSLVQRIARRYAARETQAATLSRNAVQRLLALKHCVPLLGLTGVCLVDKPSLITKDEELESVCVEIRGILSKINFDVSNESLLPIEMSEPVTLDNFELGDPIAKGCNAVVYSAKFLPEKKLSLNVINESEELSEEPATPPLSSSPPPAKYDAAMESPAGFVDTPSCVSPQIGSLEPYNIALKMMFNYDAESNAAAIWNSLSKECAPVQQNYLTDTREAKLPGHPFVVDIKVAFMDQVPLLKGAKQLYPVALPQRLHDSGIGRNATMFLAMKRYHCSLREFLKSNAIEKSCKKSRVQLALTTQLFEAINHLVEYGVAHRDIKSDNILIDLTCVTDPQLAVTDFGCCLLPEDCLSPLKLPFTSSHVSRGGNTALMAPEILTAVPGLLSLLDYSRSDLWSVATLIFEVYSQNNPFYEGILSAKTFKDDQLPSLENAPRVIQRLVRECLSRDPSQRPSPALAATICQLLLFAPSSLLQPHYTCLSSCSLEGCSTDTFSAYSPSASHIVQWLCDLAVDTLFTTRREEEKERRSTEQTLKRVFLSRVNLPLVQQAITYIINTEAEEPREGKNMNSETNATD